jgi:hypothetical protein
MNKIDLSDIYDSCYAGYDDYVAELTLRWNADSEAWQNDSVKFYKTTYGWTYEETPGLWDYGYGTLKEAVSKYTAAIAEKAATGNYTASRLFNIQYDYKRNPRTSAGHIYCAVTKRAFRGECDSERMQQINDSVSYEINKLIS